ncbi:uncharacterized protein LOC131935986 [Physella acuta]|uniref:uncharacterized protein LOC131935986 n=1 Tax=Physella acuta TaxID=109671 RepID=UPI0027DAD587|nr:uncharacterized protein LOC131935986 [Physella acuta]
MLLKLCLLLSVAVSVLSQMPSNGPACQEITSGSPPEFVQVSNDFSVDIETVSVETNRVTNMRMFYSLSQNMIRLNIFDAGVRSDLYYYFADGEILAFEYSVGRGSCQVITNITTSPEIFLVGGVKDGTKVQVPLGVLHLTGQSGFGDNQIVSQPIQKTTVRGMEVVGFNSCQKWSFGPHSAVLNVTHYFSFKSWLRPNSGTVPVMIEVQGSGVIHGVQTNIHHYYNYFNFKESVEPFAFETPSGIVCSGRTVDMPFPNSPPYIRFAGEVIDPNSKFVLYVEELFDVTDGVVVMRTQAPGDVSTNGGMNHITTIRDYVTGLSYRIDNQMQSCVTLNITDDTVLPFDFITQDGRIKQLTADQFFYKQGTNFEYLGWRNARGLSSQVWVGKTKLNTMPNQDIIVEWYFAESDVKSWNDGSTYYTEGKYRIPVRFRMWNNNNARSVDMNIYHVDFTRIMYGELDVRSCYPNRQSNYFQFVVPGGKESVMNTNLEQFKWTNVMNMANYAKVRWIRIADFQVYYEQSDAIIEFELLDAPPYAGDVDGPPFADLTLAQATANLQKAAGDGTLQINVYSPSTNKLDQYVSVKPIPKVVPNTNPGTGTTRTPPYTPPYTNPGWGTTPNSGPVGVGTTAAGYVTVPSGKQQSSDDGYSAGSMAGLGVAMLIIGAAGGGAGGFFLIK